MHHSLGCLLLVRLLLLLSFVMLWVVHLGLSVRHLRMTGGTSMLPHLSRPGSSRSRTVGWCLMEQQHRRQQHQQQQGQQQAPGVRKNTGQQPRVVCLKLSAHVDGAVQQWPV